MCKSKELQKRIATLQQEIADLMKNQRRHNFTPIEIASRQSEIFVLASQLAEISTRRIVWLTWALLIFTIALFAMEVMPIFFPQNFPTHPKTEQTSEQHQVVLPAITN